MTIESSQSVLPIVSVLLRSVHLLHRPTKQLYSFIAIPRKTCYYQKRKLINEAPLQRRSKLSFYNNADILCKKGYLMSNLTRTPRNNELEIFRFFFICAIALMHFSNSYFHSCPYFSAAYIGTEYFFLMSGYMIMKAADLGKGSPFSFTFHRMKKLYPHYITGFILLFVLTLFVSHKEILEQIETLFGYGFELFFLHAVGLKGSGLLNYPTWYLSSMIVSGFFLFALVRLNRKLYLTIIAPLAVLVTYSFFSANVGHLDVWGGNQLLGISDALTRGFASLSLGALSYHLSQYIQNRNLQLGKHLRLLLSLLELCLLLGVLGACFVADAHTQYDFYFVFMMFVAITLSLSGLTDLKRVFSHPVFGFMGQISYPMYVYQLFIICLFCLLLPNLSYGSAAMVFLPTLTVFACVLYILFRYIKKRHSSHNAYNSTAP